MSNYKFHAMNEFRAAGWLDEHDIYNDEMQQMICNHVLKLLDVFAPTEQYPIEIFEK